MGREFYCGLCKNTKNVSEIKGIILLENIIDMSFGKICNLCFYRLHNIFKSKRLTSDQQTFLHNWGVINQ